MKRKFTRASLLTGKVRTLEFEVKRSELSAFDRGVPVQEAFPNLSDDAREFIFSGITAEEWASLGSEEAEGPPARGPLRGRAARARRTP